jgi:hypothetical protein
MKARIINGIYFGGVHSQEWIDNNQDKEIGGELVSEWVLTDFLPTDEIQPQWNGSGWIESYTINVQEKEEEIIKRYNYLMMRALSSSMQKYGSYEYLNNQKQEYEEKYLVAKGLKVSVPLSSSLQKEMDRDFTDSSLIATLAYFGLTPEPTKLENFYKLIIFKYEYAENRYEIFKAFCVDYRTKCRTFLELNQIDKLDQAFAMADNLSETITDEEIETLYNEFDAL